MSLSRSTVFYRKILYNPNYYRKLSDKSNAKAALQQASQVYANPFVQQIVAGTTCGCLAGYIVRGIGRTALVCGGTGIIAYEIAKHNNLIPPNMDPKKMANEMGSKYGQQSSELMTKVKAFTGKNKVFTAAFVGGFLIGVAI